MSVSAAEDARPALRDAAALRGCVRGTVLEPADAGYTDAVQLFNAAIAHRPAAVVQVSGAADVAAVLGFAASRSATVSVRGGGCGIAGRAVAGDVVIDLSSTRGVIVDPDARTAIVRGGSTWGDVDTATQAYGLAVPGGRITRTGVAGLTLGGGDGWLSPKHGLTCDNVLAVQLVTADGRIVSASRDVEPELFWAVRGGGGNFGVVTSFTFGLHPVGPRVLGGMLLYPLGDAVDVLDVLRDLSATASDEFSTAAVFMAAPPAAFVPGNVVGHPVLAVIPAWFGDIEVGAEVLRPLRAQVRPLVDAAGPMSYVALQSMLDDYAPHGLRQHWSASVLPSLPDGLSGELIDAAAALPSRRSHISVHPARGAMTRVPADATAVSSRGASWLVHVGAQWADPARDAVSLGWADELQGRVRAHADNSAHLNVDDDAPDRVRLAFGEEHFRRLQAVKSAWDPNDVFRHCVHIPPAPAQD